MRFKFSSKSLQLFFVLYGSVVPGCSAGVTFVLHCILRCSRVFHCSTTVAGCSAVLSVLHIHFSLFWCFWFYSMPHKTICTCLAYSLTSYEQMPFHNAMSFRVRVGTKGSWFVNHESISWSHKRKFVKLPFFTNCFFQNLITLK